MWLSFRRCRHGLCGVYGQHWGGPEGDAFGRAARRFEEMGVGALLVNCIPPDHVDGMVSYLRDFTDLPLGVYPNLGYYTERGWRFEPGVGGERVRRDGAALARGGRADHRRLLRRAAPSTSPRRASAWRGTAPGHARPAEAPRRRNGARADRRRAAPAVDRPPPARRSTRCRSPTSRRARASSRPAPPASWPGATCSARASAPHQRCLDVGCGTGILAVQLALNGAAHVHALDIDDRAVANTLANAFRNGVADRVTAATVDLFPWVPEERYEVDRREPPPEARPTRSQRVVEPPAGRLLGAQPRSTS